MPHSGQDVPDDLEARLVVLAVNHAYTKEAGSPAETAAKAILELRGTSPRLYRNTLVFLAADKTRLRGSRRGGAKVPGVGLNPRTTS